MDLPREKGNGVSSVSSHEHLQNNNLPQRITTEHFARVPVDKISCVSVRRLHLKTLSHTNKEDCEITAWTVVKKTISTKK